MTALQCLVAYLVITYRYQRMVALFVGDAAADAAMAAPDADSPADWLAQCGLAQQSDPAWHQQQDVLALLSRAILTYKSFFPQQLNDTSLTIDPFTAAVLPITGPHTHTTADITNFPATMPPSAHAHPVAHISNFPTTMPPSAHQHVKAEISDFPATLPPAAHQHAISEIADFPTTMPPSAHTHVAAEITDLGTLGATAHPSYHIEGDGNVLIADYALPVKSPDYIAPPFAIIMMVTCYAPREEIFWKYEWYGSVQWQFGRNEWGALWVELQTGSALTRYTSTSTMPDRYWGKPIEIGWQIDAAGALAFFIQGICDATQPTAGLLGCNDDGTYTIGPAAIFDFHWGATCAGLLRNPGINTPYPFEGRQAMPANAYSYYYVFEEGTTTLPDAIRDRHMTIYGTVRQSLR